MADGCPPHNALLRSISTGAVVRRSRGPDDRTEVGWGQLPTVGAVDAKLPAEAQVQKDEPTPNIPEAQVQKDEPTPNIPDTEYPPERKLKLKASLWCYPGDHTQPYNVFDFTTSRTRDGPRNFLVGFCGNLQADGFSGYDGIYAGGDVIEVGCNAHARRKFFEARESDPALAATALAFYRELYAIEREIKGEIAKLGEEAEESQRAEIRLRIRQEKSIPVLDKFRAWLDKAKETVLPKNPLAGAIGYVDNQWDALTRYASSGYLSIDNNLCEHQMKKAAIGRKNWLFVGSVEGGKTAAVLLTMVTSCQRHKLDPFAYLQDVLTRLPNLPTERLVELLPDRWTPPPPEPVSQEAATQATEQAAG